MQDKIVKVKGRKGTFKVMAKAEDKTDNSWWCLPITRQGELDFSRGWQAVHTEEMTEVKKR